MISWKARLGLVLAMLAMVLAVSIPAVADDFEDFVADELAGDVDIQDVDCDVDDDGWNDDEDDDDDNDSWTDDEDDDDDNDGWTDDEDAECQVEVELAGEEFTFLIDDFDGDGWNDDEDDDDDNDGWTDDEDEDDDDDGTNDEDEDE